MKLFLDWMQIMKRGGTFRKEHSWKANSLATNGISYQSVVVFPPYGDARVCQQWKPAVSQLLVRLLCRIGGVLDATQRRKLVHQTVCCAQKIVPSTTKICWIFKRWHLREPRTILRVDGTNGVGAYLTAFTENWRRRRLGELHHHHEPSSENYT